MKIQNLKSFDPRVLVRTGAFLQDPQDHNSQCEPVGPKQAHRPPSRHQLLRFQSPIQGRVERLMTRISVRQRARVDVRQRSSSPLARDSSPGKPTTVVRGHSSSAKRTGGLTQRKATSDSTLSVDPAFQSNPATQDLADGARDPHNAFDAMLKRIRDFGSSLAPPKLFGTSCNTHKHSQSELALWERRGYSEFMLDSPLHLPVHLTSYPDGLSGYPPRAVVLIPPKEELDQAWEVESAARGAGLDITLKELTADRFERRYMSLVQEMWKEAQTRERLGAPIVQWFTLADDDTYFYR
ncbi:hypothetical protein KEM48_012822 [Puccinia striiformis f. sp. tritici PST-130]|nr:hypothetical protein KEM48_012822 [Puccinia striiformis f. sp. tritici PST-130]